MLCMYPRILSAAAGIRTRVRGYFPPFDQAFACKRLLGSPCHSRWTTAAYRIFSMFIVQSSRRYIHVWRSHTCVRSREPAGFRGATLAVQPHKLLTIGLRLFINRYIVYGQSINSIASTMLDPSIAIGVTKRPIFNRSVIFVLQP